MMVRSSKNVEVKDILGELLGGVDPDSVAGALLFVAPYIDWATLVVGIPSGIPFIGCTTLANYSGRWTSNGRDETAILVLFDGETKMKAGFLADIGELERTYIAFSSADNQLDSLLAKYRCMGGVAADDWEFGATAVFSNGLAMESGTVAIDVSELDISGDLVSGWTTVAGCKPGVVEEVSGKTVKRISGVSAVEYYKRVVPTPELFGACPLRLLDTGVNRAALGYDLSKGEITFSGEIGVGEQVVVMSALRSEVYDSSLSISGRNADKLRASDLAIAFSCAARHQILADLAHKEHEFLKMYASRVVLVSLYAEFYPVGDRTIMENQHIVLGMFKE